jgi:hypothetical protein
MQNGFVYYLDQKRSFDFGIGSIHYELEPGSSTFQ